VNPEGVACSRLVRPGKAVASERLPYLRSYKGYVACNALKLVVGSRASEATALHVFGHFQKRMAGALGRRSTGC
jgi:hypothetical protein